MNVTIGPYDFDIVDYDDDRDILGLRVDGRVGAGDGDTPENHTWMTDDDGRVVGIVMTDVRHKLERDGAVYVTLPSGERVEAPDVAAVVTAPAGRGR